MAVLRDDPYGAFNYKLTVNLESGGEIRGAFADVEGLSTEITYAEYRDGTDPRNAVRKIPMMYAVGDVTLKRGLLGSLDLWSWIKQVAQGHTNTRASVVIELMAEAGTEVVMTWKLAGARPSKWTGPQLSAKATEVAMEELVLVCEDMTVE